LLSSNWNTSIITWTDTRFVIGVPARWRVVRPSKPATWKRRFQ